MILSVNTYRTVRSQREITRPARLRRSATAVSRGLAPRSVRIKNLYFRTDRVLRISTGARPARPERRRRLADAVSYLTSEVCPVMARQLAVPGRHGHAAGQLLRRGRIRLGA